MDVGRILAEMRLEHEQLEEAIASLERLARPVKRRGRPPAWLVDMRKAQGTNGQAGGGKKRSRGDGKAPS